MYKAIDIGGKRVELQSNAATPRLYQNIFNKDLMLEFSKIDTDSLSEGLDNSGLATLDLIKGLCFTLNMQATRPFREIYGKLDEVDYAEWLTKFEEDDFYDPDTLTEIIAVWQKSISGSVVSKNPPSPQ